MLVACGFVRITTADGDDYTFTPSFERIADLGSPHEIVALYAGLHGPRAAQEAAYVLACLCDQEDPAPLIGAPVVDPDGKPGPIRWAGAKMPEAEQIILAQHLMRHGICGDAKPGDGSGKYSDQFNAAEYIGAATVHLGLSDADAAGLSMTDFQLRMELKFPNQKKAKEQEVPSFLEYQALLQRIEDGRRSRGA